MTKYELIAKLPTFNSNQMRFALPIETDGETDRKKKKKEWIFVDHCTGSRYNLRCEIYDAEEENNSHVCGKEKKKLIMSNKLYLRVCNDGPERHTPYRFMIYTPKSTEACTHLLYYVKLIAISSHTFCTVICYHYLTQQKRITKCCCTVWPISMQIRWVTFITHTISNIEK